MPLSLDPEPATTRSVRVAAQGCPVGAISLWRDGVELSLEDKA